MGSRWVDAAFWVWDEDSRVPGWQVRAAWGPSKVTGSAVRGRGSAGHMVHAAAESGGVCGRSKSPKTRQEALQVRSHGRGVCFLKLSGDKGRGRVNFSALQIPSACGRLHWKGLRWRLQRRILKAQLSFVHIASPEEETQPRKRLMEWITGEWCVLAQGLCPLLLLKCHGFRTGTRLLLYVWCSCLMSLISTTSVLVWLFPSSSCDSQGFLFRTFLPGVPEPFFPWFSLFRLLIYPEQLPWLINDLQPLKMYPGWLISLGRYWCPSFRRGMRWGPEVSARKDCR